MEFLKTAWARITSSKVAWMSIPLAFAQIYLAITGIDVGHTLDIVFQSLWSVIAIFLAINDPTTTHTL